jgi:hypothetical protein
LVDGRAGTRPNDICDMIPESRLYVLVPDGLDI